MIHYYNLQKVRIVLFFAFLTLVNSLTLKAQEKAFVREYTYKASEMDSRFSCRAIVVNELRFELLNEIGVYVESEHLLKSTEIDGKYSQDFTEKITTLTAGVTKFNILEEKWNGEEFWMRAEIIIDKKELEGSLKRLVKDRQRVKELDEIKEKLEDSTKELNRLKKEISKGDMGTALVLERNKKYNNEVNKIAATDFLYEGRQKIDNQDFLGAIRDFSSAIQMNPTNSLPYVDRGLAKDRLKDFRGAIEDYNKAIKINSNYAHAYACRASAKFSLKEFKNAVIDYTAAIENQSSNPIYYFGRGLAKIQLGKKESACSDLSKAGELGEKMAYEAIRDFCN